MLKRILSDSFQAFDDIDLASTAIIGVQHILPTTVDMFEFLFNRGLNPANCFLLGKCYSTDPVSFENLKRAGVNISFLSDIYISNRCFSDYFKENTQHFFYHSLMGLGEGIENIVILDDGGDLVSMANQNIKLLESYHLVGLEQTTSGYNKIKDIELSFPVVNIARSRAKLDHESPIIAKIAYQQMMKRIRNIPVHVKNILILGNGAVGNAMHKKLQQDFSVELFDIDPERSNLPKDSFVSKLKEFDLILGCTGSTSIKYDQYKYLKENVVLVSVSSSDIEFESHKIRRNSNTLPSPHIDLKAEGIYVLNSGFPINFDGEYPTIDLPEDFFLTRMLLSAGILQAISLENPQNKLYDLAHNYQSAIISAKNNFRILFEKETTYAQ